MVSCQKNNTKNTYRRIIPIKVKGTQQTRRPLLYVFEELQIHKETNGAVKTVLNTKNNVMGSSVEAEIGALSHSGQESEPIQTTLNNMLHSQPATPMQKDNSTTNGIFKNIVQQKLSIAMGILLFWIKN